jgi:hypothetical protein
MLVSFEDEVFANQFKRHLSGLLPHSNYKENLFSYLIYELLRLINLDEMQWEYYVFMYILVNIKKVNTGFADLPIAVSKEMFSNVLEGVIPSIALYRNVEIKTLLAFEGISDNIALPDVLEQGYQIIYKRTSELYDECFELGVSSVDSINELPALRELLMQNVSSESLQFQQDILQGEIKRGRHTFSGPRGWVSFMKHTVAELDARLRENEESILMPSTVQEAIGVLEESNRLFVPIAEYGIPMLDNKTPILRHRLVCVCGKENVGKTAYAVDLASRLLVAGKKILFMSGETKPELVYTRIISSYIKKRFNKFITREHIANLASCSEEDQKLVKAALAIVTTGGRLMITPAFNYTTMGSELESLYRTEKFDAVFIDHTKALRGGVGMSEMDKVESIAIATRTFKLSNPVYVCVLSHLSSEAMSEVTKGKLVVSSPTRGSRILTQEADDIFILTQDEMLKKQRLLNLQVYKRRDAEILSGYIRLQCFFNVAHFSYDARFQDVEQTTEDQLVAKILNDNVVSTGDYVLSGDSFEEDVLEVYDEDEDGENLFEEDN